MTACESTRMLAEAALMANEEGLFGLAGRRLLVVEDNPGCAEAVRAWLEICGAQVTTAPTVDAALGRLRAEAPDLVLLDVTLPDGTGWDLVDELRTNVPGGARVPVVAITGLGRDSVERTARAHGVDHVVTKPIAPEALVAALSACLDQAA
jgi:CheY-like chemotaxis protein